MARSTVTDDRLVGRPGRDVVSAGIRDAIQRGDMVPGQRLVELELSETFNATRSAVREALGELATEGLIELVPGRGARVRVVSVEEAVQITECRIALERLCAARAAELATKAQRADLRRIGKEMEKAVKGLALDTYSTLNRELHDSIQRISGQEVAARLLRGLNGQMVRHQFRLSMRPGRPSVSLPQHLKIIVAIDSGDPRAAEAAIEEHLTSVVEALRATPQ